jgi:hypothetical protein
MKKVIMLLIVLAAVSSARATFTYTYGPGTNFGSRDLMGNESMLVNGGQGGSLGLFATSYARIEGTTPLGTYYGGGAWAGGIWTISAGGSGSTLEILGGEIAELDMSSGAHASLSGGRVLTLATYQQAPTSADKHIDLFCKNYSLTSGILSGLWGDDTAFSIRLVNQTGYTPTIDNINFHIVPEPMTLGLLACGGLAIRRVRR